MNLEQLKKSGMIIFEAISGSIAYATNTPESDTDIRGAFIYPNEKYLELCEPLTQISDRTNDVTFYSLKKMFELLSKSSPNMIELLYLPDDCILKCHPIMKKLIENRELFISKKAYNSHSGYAYSQISRAKGQNKWVNNQKPESPPDKMDFCWFIPIMDNGYAQRYIMHNIQSHKQTPFWDILIKKGMPCRPIPIKETDLNLSYCHVAKLERVENAYRLYNYRKEFSYGDSDGRNINISPKPKGVFRGPNQQLVVESIPIEDEWCKIDGFLIYNEQAYDSAHKDWKNYWAWKRDRNEARYRSQENGEIEYDAKNMLHCMRLLWSGKNILINGEPIVRFDGENLDILKNIRAGKYSYEKLITWAEKEMKELDVLKEKSDISNSIDEKKINDLYFELINMER